MGIMDKLIIKNNISDYLSVSQYINLERSGDIAAGGIFSEADKR